MTISSCLTHAFSRAGRLQGVNDESSGRGQQNEANLLVQLFLMRRNPAVRERAAGEVKLLL